MFSEPNERIFNLWLSHIIHISNPYKTIVNNTNKHLDGYITISKLIDKYY
jgi:hypothetical protein